MNKILFYLWVFLSSILSCYSTKNKTTTINQGIEGYIYFVSGNQMPSPGKKLPPPKGIRTTLYIYTLTNLTQVKRQDQSAYYSAIYTKLISKVESDSGGYFTIQLKPGKYSLFTKTGSLFYANIFDKDNNIAPAEVLINKMTKLEIRIDHDATY
jgi:hypothetical protein